MKISIPIQSLQNPEEIAKHAEQIDKALLENPENPDLYVIKAIMCLNDEDYEGALNWARIGLGFNPRNAGIYVTFAAIYDCMGNREKTHEVLKAAYEECSNVAAINWNFALSLLGRGEWELGWDLYRWRKVHLPGHNRLLQPVWDCIGETKGKTLFVWCEQGLGDCIMAMRFIDQIKETFGFEKIVLEIQEELYTLACRTLKTVDQVFIRYEDGHMPFHFDENVSIMDLPRLFRLESIGEIDPTPYITAHPLVQKEWENKFKEDGIDKEVKIAINWYGSPGHANNSKRSAFLKDFEPLQEVGTLFAVQKDNEPIPNNERPETMKLLSAHSGLVNADFTTGCLGAMDVVVTIDSFIAHLAGAMGKKVFLLLPFIGEWRWEKEYPEGKSYWYENVYIIRQTVRNSWKEPIEVVVNRIKACQITQPGLQ